MARFYTEFTNADVPALDADTVGNRFQRLAITGGAGLKATLVAARAVLSTAVYAQLDEASKNGTLGRCIVQDGYSRGGGALTWTDIYTNTAALWNSDPKVRPTAAIVIANSTHFAADGGSVNESGYTDAQSALEAILSAVSMRTHRTPSNLWLMLASLFYDQGLNYIGWDDYTPGQPQTCSIDANPPIAYPGTSATVTCRWNRQYPSDDDYSAMVRLQLTQTVAGIGGGATSYDSGEVAVDADDDVYAFNPSGLQGNGSEYDAVFTVRFRNSVPSTIYGALTTVNEPDQLIFEPNA